MPVFVCLGPQQWQGSQLMLVLRSGESHLLKLSPVQSAELWVQSEFYRNHVQVAKRNHRNNLNEVVGSRIIILMFYAFTYHQQFFQ